MEHLPQIILLLAVAIGVVLLFQRLQVPTSLGYLLAGMILGPHTFGPRIDVPAFSALAEFGVVFLLFTIGLNFSLPRLRALRHQVLWPGTGQVLLTTLVAGTVVWIAGLPPAVSFVFGAAFAQSSTTVMASILNERGEENSHHGRLGVAMSVFQDVTAVPFLVIIPVLGTAVSFDVLALALGWALAKALAAMLLVIFAGRWLLDTLFAEVARHRSMEVFTLAVLGALLLLLSKTGIVWLLLRWRGVERFLALRTGLLLSVGGEFGLALVAIAIDAGVLDIAQGQVAISAILLGIVAGAAIVRCNGALASLLLPSARGTDQETPNLAENSEQQVVIGGYGRVGETVALLLQARGIPFLAFDTDPQRVRHGRRGGHPVYLGDLSDPELLSSIRVDRAALVVLAIDQPLKAERSITCLRRLCPQVPVIARARDLATGLRLQEAGAVHACPEAVEASLSLGEAALELLEVPVEEIKSLVDDFRANPSRLAAVATPSAP